MIEPGMYSTILYFSFNSTTSLFISLAKYCNTVIYLILHNIAIHNMALVLVITMAMGNTCSNKFAQLGEL